jgi:hypothetical protein
MRKLTRLMRIEESLVNQIEELAKEMHAPTTWTTEYLLRQQLERIAKENNAEDN